MSQPSRIQSLIDSLLRTKNFCNAAGCGVPESFAGEHRELDRELEVLESLAFTISRVGEWDRACSALEQSTKGRIALAQLLSVSLRAASVPSASASSSAASSSDAGSTQMMADTDSLSSERALRVLTATAIVATQYLGDAWRCARSSPTYKELPVGVSSLVEGLLRADLLPAVTRFLTAARQQPPALLLPGHTGLIVHLSQILACIANTRSDMFSLLLTPNRIMEAWARAAAESMCPPGQTHGSLLRELLEDVEINCSIFASPSHMRALHSGTCLQYWTALQAVSQLHAADGGKLYGLPHAALLPPEWAEREGLQGQAGQRGQVRRFLRCSGLRSSLHCWAWCLDPVHPVSLGPLRPRALRSVALRTARAALASCEVHDIELAAAMQALRRGRGQQGQVQAGGGGSGGGTGSGNGGGSTGRVALRHPLEAAGCYMLARQALRLVLDIIAPPEQARPRSDRKAGSGAAGSRGFAGARSSSGHGSGGQPCGTPPQLDGRLREAYFAARWWPLVVRAVWAALRRPGGLRTADVGLCGELLPMVQQWELRVDHEDSLGVQLPASPPSGLSFALSSGLIPTTEALLRTMVTRAAAASSYIASSLPSAAHPRWSTPKEASQQLASILDRISGSHLVLLLAHGDPVQCAALLTTLAKVVLFQAEVAARAKADEGAFALVRAATRIMYDLASAVRVIVGRGAGQGTGSAEFAQYATNTAGVLTNLMSIGLLNDDLVQTIREATEAEERKAAAQRAAAVAMDSASMLARCTPPEQQLLRLWCFAVPRWLPVLNTLTGILEQQGGDEDSPEHERLSSALTGFKTEMVKQAAVACRGAWHRGDMRAVYSWRGLLQRDVCVREMIGTYNPDRWEAEDWWSATLPPPQQWGSGGGVTGGGRSGGGGGLGAGSSSSSGSSSSRKGEVPIKTSWPFLLPLAPHEAASLLPTCSNPLCTELQGDTEPDLRQVCVAAGLMGEGPGAGAVGARAGQRAAGAGAGAGAGNNRLYCGAGCLLTHQQLHEFHIKLMEKRKLQDAEVLARNEGKGTHAAVSLIVQMMEQVDIRPQMQGL